MKIVRFVIENKTIFVKYIINRSMNYRPDTCCRDQTYRPPNFI